MQQTDLDQVFSDICPRLYQVLIRHCSSHSQCPSDLSLLILSGHTEDYFSLPFQPEPLPLFMALQSLYRDRFDHFIHYSMTDGLRVISNGTSLHSSSSTAPSSSTKASRFLDMARAAQREVSAEGEARGRYQHEPHQALMSIHQQVKTYPRNLCLIEGIGDWEPLSEDRPDVLSALQSWPDQCMAQQSLIIFSGHHPSSRLCQLFRGRPYTRQESLKGPDLSEIHHWFITRELNDQLEYDPLLTSEISSHLQRIGTTARVGLKSLHKSIRGPLDETWLAQSGARTFDPKRVDIKGLEKWFQESLIGQSRAKHEVLKSAKNMKYFGNAERKQPLLRALFTGPPGVGKTEIARGLSLYLYGQNDPLLINCTEYQQEHEVAKLLGSPPGYVGFGDPSLIERFINEHRAGVIIFDEFEKAHKKVHQALMGILEEGVLNTPSGDQVILDRSVIIATSNAGHTLVQQQLREAKVLSKEQIRKLYELGVEECFDAPLLRRFDVKVTFDFLSVQELKEVAEFYLKKAIHNYAPAELEITWSAEYIRSLVQRSDASLGAGELKNVVIADFMEALIEHYHECEPKPQSLTLHPMISEVKTYA